MVSKLKRTPIKSIKDRRSSTRRSRRKSPIKHVVAASTAVLASIQRRLSKLFSKWSRLGTPNNRKGYKVLRKKAHYEEEPPRFHDPLNDICRTLFFKNPLPPLISPNKRTVFLDLDETLVHSKADPPPEWFDFVVQPRIDGELMNFYVLKRPGVDELLESLAAKFEVVVFTAAVKEYASMVLDKLDGKRLISHRLYRDSCREVEGKFVKDLSELGRDLKRVVIVDDNPNCYEFQPDNAIPIRSFVDDLGDKELTKLLGFFEVCDCYDDMRDAVKHYLSED